jgi:nitrilase
MTEAVRRGARLLALPENLTYVGDDEKQKLAIAEEVHDGPGASFLRAFAQEHSVTIVGGSLPLKTASTGKVTNTCLVFGQTGGLLARYDKIHLFDAQIDPDNPYRESRLVEPGSRPVTFVLEGRTIGLSICYDLRFPELYRELALQGADVLFVPSAFTRETGRDHWEILLRARAIENLCYVVAAAQSGDHGGGRASYGRSMIVGPWGQILAQCQDGEGFALADLDFDSLQEARATLPGVRKVTVRSSSSR